MSTPSNGPAGPTEVRVPVQDVSRLEQVLGREEYARALAQLTGTARRLAGRVVWHVNSTAQGGGVAEMLGPLIGFARGLGVDSRWLVIAGDPEFFRVTKRLHNLLHGDPGDGGPLGDDERRVYEATLARNAVELRALSREGDVVVLHDPQTAGLIPAMRDDGGIVVWRCHIGHEDLDHPLVARAWAFLAPYLGQAHATLFSRSAYIPRVVDPARAGVMHPSIDPFSPKNQQLPDDVVRAMLVRAGIVAGPPGPARPVFRRADGSPGRVDRRADVTREGPPPPWDAPLVVQVSRWDRLKDHAGVMAGFCRLDPVAAGDARLVLAGPAVAGVADDPEGPAVLAELTAAWRALPDEWRRRVQIAALSMRDVQENAATVNALQRHAAVIVQKSLQEGFGLTVTEAMWKGRPVIASAVGGIRDQIDDGVDGLLLDDPTDSGAFADALARVLGDPGRARALGEAAHARVRREFLGVRHLIDYARLIDELLA